MENQRKIRILLVGGGTGGHAFPLVAVGQSFKDINPDIELALMGDRKFLDSVSNELGVPYIAISGPKWDRTSIIAKIIALASLPVLIYSFAKCLYWMWRFMPDAVFAKGGYPSLIPALVAKLYSIPLYIHESDAVAGATNRFLGKLADKIFLGFQEASVSFDANKISVVGVPIRKAKVEITKESSRAYFNFTEDKPIILITGASQGAQAINNVIITAILLLCQKFNVIHQCGENNFEDLKKTIDKIKTENANFKEMIEISYKLYSILDIDQFQKAIMASDAVVSRAGSSLFELAAYHKPIIAIPLPSAANDHQKANAYSFAKFGVKIIEQDNLTPNVLIYAIEESLKNKDELYKQLESFGFDSADVIANDIYQNINR